jgi:hypothetical protein
MKRNMGVGTQTSGIVISISGDVHRVRCRPCLEDHGDSFILKGSGGKLRPCKTRHRKNGEGAERWEPGEHVVRFVFV